MDIIIAVIIGLFAFICTVLSFGLGIKYGMAIKNGSQPKIEPLKPIIEYKERKAEKKKAEEQINAFKNLMSYNGETQ